jgi:hypothetical protein
MEAAKRLNRGNKTKANNHQRLNQNNGCVIADNNLENMNINIFTQLLASDQYTLTVNLSAEPQPLLLPLETICEITIGRINFKLLGSKRRLIVPFCEGARSRNVMQ